MEFSHAKLGEFLCVDALVMRLKRLTDITQNACDHIWPGKDLYQDCGDDDETAVNSNQDNYDCLNRNVERGFYL